MRRFFTELFSLLSRLVNVLTGGIADMTFSARVHMDGWRRVEAVIDAVFRVLRGEIGHCETWFHHDVARARALVAAADRMTADEP